MKIERFEDIEAWRLARELARKVYRLTKKPRFETDFGLKRQIQEAAGSAMHNIAEGFDAETNAEFVRFLRYAKRSCTEVQSELYVAMDEEYISVAEFQDVYEQARRARAAIRGFINYLKQYQARVNGEPNNEVQRLRGSTVQGFSGSTVQGSNGSEVQGFNGSEVQGFSGSTVKRFKGSGVENLQTPTNPQPLNHSTGEPSNR